MQIYNFLSRKTEEFKSISDVVGLYTCGPTVYDYVHIGNWRTFVFEDILRRVLEFNGYKVKQVMNITDVDDKIIKKSIEQKSSLKDVTAGYERAFFEELQLLNILKAAEYPKATDNINLMINLIQKLLSKGVAYKADDGVYFSVEKFKSYGQLSGLSKGNLKKGARINEDQYDKESWADFALWKFPPSHKQSLRSSQAAGLKASEGKSLAEPTWDAPFGRGRPGWHIECSAMSMKYLGDQIDIHTGGVDLLFPHHENEIAQSEAVIGKKFVNFWLEGEHLLVEGQKMAKSLGNIFTLSDIKKKGFEPLALRYLFLTAHYRSKLNFTWKSLEASQNALDNLRSEVSTWDEPKIGCSEYEGNFKEAVGNDLDIPKALSIMWETVKSDYPSSARHQSVLVMDKVLGLGLDKLKRSKLPKGAKELIEKREELRKKGDFNQSDKMRKELAKIGVIVEDTPQGPKWKVSKK